MNMEDSQLLAEMPNVDFKINSTAENVSNDGEEIEYCLEATSNITQPVKNDGDHDTFSDEGNEKVLTTLETIQTEDHDDEEPYTTYEIEDLPLGQSNERPSEEKLSASEIARLQLESLGTQKVGRPKKYQFTILDEKGNATSKVLLPTETKNKKLDNNISNVAVLPARSSASLVTLVSPNVIKEQEIYEAEVIPVEESNNTTSENDCTLESRISNLTESPNMGVIEIPKELITGNTFTTSICEQNATKLLQNEDLLAILEGNDDSMEEKKSAEVSMSAEEEKAVAMKQIMNLPVNPRGRRPNSQKAKPKKVTKPKTTNLVSSLVSDWSDNDSGSKKGESEGESEKPKQTPKSTKPAVLNSQIDNNDRTERRSRIIKKKIIWDPDAPETAFSYASLVQSTSKKPKIVPTKPKEKELEETNDLRKRKSDSISPANAKKKRVGEIDKLLADEGAINILNALKHENNNADMSESMGSDSMVSEKCSSKRIARKTNVDANDISQGRQNESTKQDTVQKNARKGKTTPAVAKKEPKKRSPNKSASSSWDYIYNDKLGQRGDDSMIIRRRSNSSYSSTASVNRLSIDAPSLDNEKTIDGDTTSFEFAKPSVKKTTASENAPQKQLILADLRGKVDKKVTSKVEGDNATRRSSRTIVVENLENNVKEQQRKPEILTKRKGDKGHDIPTYTEINVKMMKHCAHIELVPASNGKLRNSYTIQMMDEVSRALTDLNSNSAIKSVLVSSSNGSFCNEIDFSSLIQSTADKRKQAATDLSTSLRNFIMSIVKFKKILIAGVHGHTVGIGVTILPLFDIIFATNKSTFSTSYVKIGQVPENGTLFVQSNKISHRLKTDLLYMNETIKAADALQNGLVTKVLNPEVFEAEIVRQTEEIALQSSQFLETTKSLTQFDIIENKLDTDLANEQKLLIQHWTSSECQDRFKNFLLKEKWQN